MKTKHTFRELTYTDGEGIEVMVHRETGTDRVIAIYTYARDAQPLNDTTDEHGKPIRPFNWQPGQNSLFVHLPKGQIARFVRLFIDSNDLVCTEEDSE